MKVRYTTLGSNLSNILPQPTFLAFLQSQIDGKRLKSHGTNKMVQKCFATQGNAYLCL